MKSIAILTLAIMFNALVVCTTEASGKKQDVDTTLTSSALQKDMQIKVRLPDSYHESQSHFPLVILLDANSFYQGELELESVNLIQSLERFDHIPPSIVVSVKSTQWYRDVIANGKDFSLFLNKELMEHMNKEYRVGTKQILIGHSYAGAFVIGHAATETNVEILALSPLFPERQHLQEVADAHAKLNHKARPKVIIGDEDTTDLQLISDAMNNSKTSNTIDLMTLKDEEHQSVLIPGLRMGLRSAFSTYRAPTRSEMGSTVWSLEDIDRWVENAYKEYPIFDKEKRRQSVILEGAFSYTQSAKLDAAWELWQASSSRFKSYFLQQYVERFFNQGKDQIALRLLNDMLNQFPQDPSAHHRLAQYYSDANDSKLASMHKEGVNKVLSKVDGKANQWQLNQFAYQLLAEGKTELAIIWFTKITQAFPTSANAFDSLADAYDKNEDYKSAILAMENALSLAKEEPASSKNRYQQKLDTLKSKL